MIVPFLVMAAKLIVIVASCAILAIIGLSLFAKGSGEPPEKKPCPHCQQEITACPTPCETWECAYYEHLQFECRSSAADLYRAKIAAKVARREAQERGEGDHE